MIAQARFTCAYSMLLAVVALAPTGLFAQQGQNQQGPDQPKAAQAQTEDARRQPEAAQAQPEGAQAQTEVTQAQTEKDPKVISGMSILGNQEAPKALVIIPWKGSELGNAVGVTTMLDDSRLPIDKEVFMRMLSYYEIRSEITRPGGAPAKTNAAPATVAQRRKP